MIVVTIIGLLAAVALPSYQEYTIRSRVSELVLAAAALKSGIAEAAWTNKTLANSGAGFTVSATGRVTGGMVDPDGTITVIGSSAASSVGTAVTITLTPSYSPIDGKIVWACATGGNTAVYRFVPSDCRQ